MATINDYYRGDSDYWRAYREGRPAVPDSYFERILEYHAQNGGQFNVFHDMGAGSAVHTGRMAPRFKETIISDPGVANIEAARSYLGEDPKYEFRVSKAEETLDIKAESVDLIFGANMMHYTDPELAMRAIIRQLKPGGTLALAGFGYVILLDAELQKLWTGLIHRVFEFVCERNEQFLQAATIASSPYDSVPFDTQYFQPGALRIKLNEREGWTIRKLTISENLAQTSPYVQRIGENDKLIREDNENWSFDADVTIMRKILDTYPLQPDTILDERWRQFESAFGSRIVRAVWPATLDLATKNFFNPIDVAPTEVQTFRRPHQLQSTRDDYPAV